MFFCFTVDDNIRFLKALNEKKVSDIFENKYLALFKRLHLDYDLKVQLNLFYKYEDFCLADMTDRYKRQFSENADWLKLSFHSYEENYSPYENADYKEVFGDADKVDSEIIRFAGRDSLADTTTVHFCRLTEGGLRAIKDCGIKGLLGLFGDENEKEVSYGLSEKVSDGIRQGEIYTENGIAYSGIDVILNLYDRNTILERLKNVVGRKFIKIMIHEQYFYKDYKFYQADFADKVESAVRFLTENGYKSTFFEDVLKISE